MYVFHLQRIKIDISKIIRSCQLDIDLFDWNEVKIKKKYG